MRKSTLVLGASVNTGRYSNIAIRKLIEKKSKVFAIGNKKGHVLGVPIEEEKLLFEDIDTVTLYLNPVRQKEYYQYILSLNPKRVIFNPGTENREFETVLKQNNIETIRACTLVLLSLNKY
jgi:predicted CoA-binding protein